MTIISNDKMITMDFNVGDKVFLVRNIKSKCLCGNCNGVGYKDEKECPICNGKGLVSRRFYIPIPVPAEVVEIRTTFNQHGCDYTYKLVHENRYMDCVTNQYFKSYEDAVKFCKKQNVIKVIMNISDIKIPNGFKHTYPHPEKMAARMEEIREHGKFTNMIEVDENNVLIDGYTTYVLAKGFGFNQVEVMVHKM